MPHEIRIVEEGSLMLVTVSRELEGGSRETVNRLRDLCRREIGPGVSLVVDFSGINICPSMVWGNLIVQAKRMREDDGAVAICGLRPTVAKAVQIIGMGKYVEICKDSDEAVLRLRGEGGSDG